MENKHPDRLLWDKKTNKNYRSLRNVILEPIKKFLLVNFRYRRNAIRHLRSLGVKIGANCAILNQPRYYGSEPWLIEIGNQVTVTGLPARFICTLDESIERYQSKIVLVESQDCCSLRRELTERFLGEYR